MRLICNLFLFMFLFLYSSIIVCNVKAQEPTLNINKLQLTTQCSPEIKTNRHALILHDNANGLWFQTPIAMCMLERLNLLPSLVDRIKLLEHRNDSADELILIQQKSIDLALEAQKTAEESLGAAIRGKRNAEEKLNHWTRSLWLWTGVGAAAAITITLVAIWAIDSVAGSKK